MDRRDALKKLGMGGATVVGATMVMSTPALAQAGTPGCAATNLTLSISASQTGNGGGQNPDAFVTFTPTTTTNCPCNDPAAIPSLTVTSASIGTVTAPGPTVGPLGNGNNYSYSVTIRANCLDGGNIAVCSTATVTGTISINGTSQPGQVLAATQITFSGVAC
jgi:hypothetical protein